MATKKAKAVEDKVKVKPSSALGIRVNESLASYTRRAMEEYGVEVIEGRAVSGLVDGLKPVHRAILWSMYTVGNKSNGGFKKSAKTVGDCFPAGTAISMADGTRKDIVDVKVGDVVRTMYGPSEVQELFIREAAEDLIDIDLDNGTTLSMTPDQLVKVARGSDLIWVAARNLTEEDSVVVE